LCPRQPEQAAFLCFWPSTRKTMVSYQLRTSSPLRTVAIPSLLLNGETLATISFEELCDRGLVRGGESFRPQPAWGESGKAAAVALSSQIRVDWRGRSIFFCCFFAVCGASERLDLSFSPNANPRKFSSATLVESAAWIQANFYPKARSYSTTFRDIFPSHQSGAIQSYFLSIIIDLSPSNIT